MHRYQFPSRPVANSAAIITDNQRYRFTVITDGLLRYEWAADDGCFEDRASVFAINRDFPVPKFRVNDSDSALEIVTNRFHLTYDKTEFSPSGLSAIVKGSFSAHGSLWRYGQEKGNLHGTARTLDEADGRVALGPGVISREGYATIDDSNSMLFEGNGWVAGRRSGNRVDGYLFAYGHDFAAAIQALYALSGAPPILPRWALGNWWSRYHPYKAGEYLDLMDQFRSEGIPLSVAVLDMDWHLVEAECIWQSGATGWTGYTWNKDLFPDPAAFLRDLHCRNLKVTINDHPAGGVYSYEDGYEAMAKALKHDTSSKDPIQFDITDRNFLDAYFDILHRPFEDQGVDFWWIDWQQGEHSRIPGIDPLWMLNHFHMLDSANKNHRPVIFSRYAGPGSHRYPIGFSGDTFTTWKSLDFQPEFTLTASNIGYGWWSHDIGGHFHGQKDDEMTTRWVQFGVFSPIMRLHSSNNPWNTKEPWKFGLEPASVMTKFLQLRHRLVPYIYTMNIKAAGSGGPIVQPMYWKWPKREEAYRARNQYYFGSELIVAPITSPKDPKLLLGRVKAWLPPGRYVDFFTGATYDGDREIWISRPLSLYPVFAKEGSVVILDAAQKPANGCSDPTALEVSLVVGADGGFDMLEDDHSEDNADPMAFVNTPVSFCQATGVLQIGPTQQRSSTPSTRKWCLRLVGFRSPSVLKVLIDDKEQLASAKAVPNGLLVDLGDLASDAKITVELGPNPQLTVTRPSTFIQPFLDGAQISYDLKQEIWDIVAAKIPKVVQASRLHALVGDENLLTALLEYVLADSRAE